MQLISLEVQHHTSPSKICLPQRCRVTEAWKIFVLFAVTVLPHYCNLVSVNQYINLQHEFK